MDFYSYKFQNLQSLHIALLKQNVIYNKETSWGAVLNLFSLSGRMRSNQVRSDSVAQLSQVGSGLVRPGWVRLELWSSQVRFAGAPGQVWIRSGLLEPGQFWSSHQVRSGRVGSGRVWLGSVKTNQLWSSWSGWVGSSPVRSSQVELGRVRSVKIGLSQVQSEWSSRIKSNQIKLDPINGRIRGSGLALTQPLTLTLTPRRFTKDMKWDRRGREAARDRATFQFGNIGNASERKSSG